jgi:5-methylcytosine-specific restriction endonuclease McrA
MTTPIVVPPVDSDNLKRCSKCGELKPATTEYFSRKRNSLRAECKTCCAAYTRAWRTANPAQKRASNQAWREAHPDYSREWRIINRASASAYDRAWYEANPEKKQAQILRRRAKKSGAESGCTASDLNAIRASQTDNKGQLICWRCHKPINGTPHLDHFIPLDKGGKHAPGNLHYMHAKCNLNKSNKHPHELGMLI